MWIWLSQVMDACPCNCICFHSQLGTKKIWSIKGRNKFVPCIKISPQSSLICLVVQAVISLPQMHDYHSVGHEQSIVGTAQAQLHQVALTTKNVFFVFVHAYNKREYIILYVLVIKMSLWHGPEYLFLLFIFCHEKL